MCTQPVCQGTTRKRGIMPVALCLQGVWGGLAARARRSWPRAWLKLPRQAPFLPKAPVYLSSGPCIYLLNLVLFCALSCCASPSDALLHHHPTICLLFCCHHSCQRPRYALQPRVCAVACLTPCSSNSRCSAPLLCPGLPGLL